MLRFSSSIAALLLVLTAGCSTDQPPTAPTPSLPATARKRKPPSPSASPSASLQRDTFNDALDAETSAKTIAQSARSRDDWDLVANKWEEAIDLMKAVPNSSKNYANARKKLPQYQSSLALAAKKAGRPPKTASPASSPFINTTPKPSPKAVGVTPKPTPSTSPTSSPTTKKSP